MNGKEISALAYDEASVYKRFESLIELNSKNILEIGGCLSPLIYSNNIQSWTSLDPLHAPDQGQPLVNPQDAGKKKQLRFICSRAEDLDFPSESFDCIFSCNALHHVQDLLLVLRKLHAVLKKGGYVYASFGPIWSAPDGSHIEGQTFAGIKYDFWKYTLIPYWSHLIFTPAELLEVLQQFHPTQFAQAIVQWVYHIPWINRLLLNDYESIIKKTDFEIILFNKASQLDYKAKTFSYDHALLKKLEPQNLKKEIQKKHRKLIDIKTRDLEILLRKK